MKEHNEIDLLFQSALGGLELTPDASVKENIDRAIASKKKRRRFLFILFPVLFGIIGFAAILPFIQNEKQNENEEQKQHEDFAKLHTNIKEKQHVKLIHHSVQATTGAHSHFVSNEEGQLPRGSFKTNRSFRTTKPIESQNNLSFNLSPDLPIGSEIETRTQEHSPQTNITPEKKPVEQRPTEQDSIIANESKPDSTLANSPTDSTGLIVAKALEKMGPGKSPDRWSLAVLTYWEGEKKRALNFDNTPFIDQKRETARIHSSTFYGKIEINRRLAARWEVLTGIGFRSSKIVQYGYLERIEIPVEGASSGWPQPITPAIPDTIQRSEVQSFRVNSIVLPIGLAYSLPIGNKLKLRFSGGGEFAYGKIISRKSHPDLSAPKFNPFGFNIWLRPEIHYSFGRTQLFGFGTFNQALSQQLKWDFEPRRNPAFGGGIGLRIQL